MPDTPSVLPVAQYATVEGRVQGVGFRWSACEEARRLGVVGWIRNTAAGTVETYFEGLPAAADAFASWLRRGPPGARVDTMTLRAAAPLGTYRRFSIES